MGVYTNGSGGPLPCENTLFVVEDDLLLLPSRALRQIDERREEAAAWFSSSAPGGVSDFLRQYVADPYREYGDYATVLLYSFIVEFDLDFAFGGWDGVVPACFSKGAALDIKALGNIPFLCGKRDPYVVTEYEGLCNGLCHEEAECYDSRVETGEVLYSRMLPEALLAVMEQFVDGDPVKLRSYLSISYLVALGSYLDGHGTGRESEGGAHDSFTFINVDF